MIFRSSTGGAIMVRRRSSRTTVSASRTRRSAPRNSRKQCSTEIETTVAVLTHELSEARRQLAEALEQQTATSEVLKVISSSPGELEPVFKAMLENATKLCGASYGTMWLKEGEGFRAAARHGTLPVVSTEGGWTGTYFQPRSDIPLARCARTRTAVHVTDMREEQSYLDGDPWIVSGVDEAGVRSLLAVPMLKDNEPVGAIGIYRTEVRSFSDKQIELVTNFAAQAVIAIDNARLVSELRARTGELTQSLEQQTAISEVLQIIASSPGELKPIVQAMLANATRLCKASYGGMWLKEGDHFRNAAFHGPLPEAFLEQWRNATVNVTASLVRAAQSRKPFQVTDLRQDRSYLDGHPLSLSAVHVADILTVAFVPMLKGDEFVGVICVYRKEVRPFTDQQIELVQNLANQTVIALEQARLLNELRQSLQQQTATAEVLKIISRSAFALRTVLQTLVESAARLCDADKASIIRERDGAFYRAEAYGFSREYLDYVQHSPVKPDRGSASGRALLEGRVIHIADATADPEYTLTDVQRLGGYRTVLSVPMLREGVPIGVLAVLRTDVRPFTDKQIELVTTFADQASIAIENVRLFDEIQDKSRQLEEASQHKSQFLANMSHELRTPLNAILGYSELMRDGAYGELSDKMLGVLKRLEEQGKHLLGLINDVLDLSKIEAGQLVLSLNYYSIKDMMQGVYLAVEPLAGNKKLNFKLEVPPNLPPARGDERRLSQVLLNLVGNAIKFTDTGEVAMKVSTAHGSYTVAVRDTGPGIAEADQVKIFEIFQQSESTHTKAKGGTGLGLAISKRIIEMHGGRIWVESQPGQGSTFAFTLPVVVEQQINVEPK